MKHQCAKQLSPSGVIFKMTVHSHWFCQRYCIQNVSRKNNLNPRKRLTSFLEWKTFSLLCIVDEVCWHQAGCETSIETWLLFDK